MKEDLISLIRYRLKEAHDSIEEAKDPLKSDTEPLNLYPASLL
jgi:hypothetical protein